MALRDINPVKVGGSVAAGAVSAWGQDKDVKDAIANPTAPAKTFFKKMENITAFGAAALGAAGMMFGRGMVAEISEGILYGGSALATKAGVYEMLRDKPATSPLSRGVAGRLAGARVMAIPPGAPNLEPVRIGVGH